MSSQTLTLKLKKPAAKPVIKAGKASASKKPPTPQAIAAAKRLANRLVNDEQHALRLAQIEKFSL